MWLSQGIGLGHSDARDATEGGGCPKSNWGYIIYEWSHLEFQRWRILAFLISFQRFIQGESFLNFLFCFGRNLQFHDLLVLSKKV